MLLNTAPQDVQRYCTYEILLHLTLFLSSFFERWDTNKNFLLKEYIILLKEISLTWYPNSNYNKVQVATFWKPKAAAWKIGLFYNLINSLKLDRTAETFETIVVGSWEGFKQSCCDGHWISVGTRRIASLLIQFAAQKTMKTDLNKWFGESERSTKGKKSILYHHIRLNLIMEGHRIWLVVWALSEMDCVPVTSTHLYTNMPTSWPNVVYQSWFMENKAI